MENYKNLNFSAEQINQKLAWVGDKSKLATTLQETPVNQFMFTKDQKTLKTIIDANNQIITVETNDMITEPGSKLESWNVYVDHLLCINSIAWEVDSSSTKYDFNNQIENLTIDKMTLSTSTEEDLAIYSPDNQNFYTLKLQ